MDASANLIESLAEQIHARIISGEYRPGERLKQERLAELFGVSRTPIREALSRLDARGIVRQENRRSAVVSASSPREINDMYQVRAELEGLASQLAAQWIDDNQVKQLRLAHERFVAVARQLRSLRGKTAVDRTASLADEEQHLVRDWIDTNSAFHQIILDASGNSALQKILPEVSSGYVRNVMLSSASETSVLRLEGNIAGHEAIFAAIKAREPTRARATMESHIREAGVFVTMWFERQKGPK